MFSNSARRFSSAARTGLAHQRSQCFDCRLFLLNDLLLCEIGNRLVFQFTEFCIKLLLQVPEMGTQFFSRQSGQVPSGPALTIVARSASIFSRSSLYCFCCARRVLVRFMSSARPEAHRGFQPRSSAIFPAGASLCLTEAAQPGVLLCFLCKSAPGLFPSRSLLLSPRPVFCRTRSSPVTRWCSAFCRVSI